MFQQCATSTALNDAILCKPFNFKATFVGCNGEMWQSQAMLGINTTRMAGQTQEASNPFQITISDERRH
jgi:hypothetical protein